MVTFPMTLTDS